MLDFSPLLLFILIYYCCYFLSANLNSPSKIYSFPSPHKYSTMKTHQFGYLSNNKTYPSLLWSKRSNDSHRMLVLQLNGFHLFSKQAMLIFCPDIIIKIMLKHQESSHAVNSVLNLIDNKIWQLVAERKVAQMTPVNVRLMNQYTFQSLAELSSTYLQKADPLQQKQIGPTNPKQTIIEGSIPVTHKTTSSFMPNTAGMMNTNKLTKISLPKKNSRASSKIEQLQRSKTNNSLENIIKFVSLQSKQGNTQATAENTSRQKALESEINAQRQKKVFQSIKQQEQQRILDEKMEKKQQREAKLRKKLKQIHRLSYDYSGEFFNAGGSNPNGTLGGAASMKSTINHEKLQTMTQGKKLISNLRMKTISTLIQNSRIQERKEKMLEGRMLTESMEPYFRETNAARFSKSFKQEDCLSQGCKIEQKSLNLSMERTLNRTGQNKTLDEFKKESATRKYKQFRLKTSKKLKTNKMIQLNQEQSLEQSVIIRETNGKNRESGRQLKTMISSDKSQILSNSILSQKFGRSRERGSIKISNPSLYESVVSED